jgi:hypothetical protein
MKSKVGQAIVFRGLSLPAVAHALVRAASALVPTPGLAAPSKCRDESRHGTHECVRHVSHSGTADFRFVVILKPHPQRDLHRAHGVG